MPDASLTRADELPALHQVLQGGKPQLVARNDLLAIMSPHETNALFAVLLEQARPGARLLALPEGALLVDALLAAIGLAPADERTAALATRIEQATTPAQREAWRERLAGLKPEGLGERACAGALETARRVALVASGDLRFAIKTLARLEEGLPKLPSAGRFEDLDAFFAASPSARSVIAFAACSLLGEVLGR